VNEMLRNHVVCMGLATVLLSLSAGCSRDTGPERQSSPPSGSSTFQVEKTDTVDMVAHEFGVEVADLLENNPDLPRTEPLDKGRVLQIPARLDSTPVVPTLKPDVPESSGYSGTFNLILGLRDAAGSWLKPWDALSGDFKRPAQPQTADITEAEVQEWLEAATLGTYRPALFAAAPAWIDTAREIHLVAKAIEEITPAMALAQLQTGKRIQITPKGSDAGYVYRFVQSFEPFVHTEPQLLLVEHYRLTNFVSDYGTGRIIKTFSLMPGEKAELTVSSFTRETLRETQASSILDSYSDETLAEFENSIRKEQSSQVSSSSKTSTQASASASASWGWGKAEASGSYSNATNEARARFAGNVASATAKNTARASAARNIEINTNVERTLEEGREEQSIRTVENINSSRTLNFIFYQMNQRYVSLLHLTEIELGYDDGHGNLTVVPLYEMRSLLDQVVSSDKVDLAERAINAALDRILDYRGRPRPGFITEDHWLKIGSPEKPAAELNIADASEASFVRVNRDYVSSYQELSSGREFFVEGVVVDAQPLVLRTDGVYVESLLGQSSAWSPHTEKIKAEELRKLQLENDRLKSGL